MPSLVILAAGASSRLGSCKALASLGSRPAIRVLLDSAAGLCEGRPLVVTGAHHPEILEVLNRSEVDVLHNPDWEAGRTGGLLLATQVRAETDFMVAPVDHPLVKRATFEALLSTWEANGDPHRGWLAPRHGDQFGHPVIIGRDLLAYLAGAAPSDPLRGLRGKAAPMSAVQVDDVGILLGLDTRRDLARLREVGGYPATDGAI